MGIYFRKIDRFDYFHKSVWHSAVILASMSSERSPLEKQVKNDLHSKAP
ncbi:hypothetical protein BRCON_2542 [Candidatus Sumerlaea chitinivorans]|uniref:Uncharacterized protein n=1 Tax=Sumerlaea chitinivorans TaxID=2250252 RepID=A0A2Z4Y7Q6_SUMC1|nr:hypothetical protein BRCON_2542 [Candidatus Sumerlaea chitinivorans]